MLLWNPLWLPVVTGYAALMATFSDMPQRQFKDESSEQLTKFRSHGEFKIEHEWVNKLQEKEMNEQQH